jgi:Uncharacterized protein conserved in bacteria (DUF2325)
MLQSDGGRGVQAKLAPPSRLRTRIWEIHNSLHCSIIGTCLTTAELKRMLLRLAVAGADAADDHELHQLGVLLARDPRTGAKHLQKALDRRHALAINQFAKAKDMAAIAALWEAAVKRGDIPGAYWAVLTHPASSEALVKRVFGEVHMLSHLVGAAHRADIQRLCQFEEEIASLTATVERQQAQLREGFMARNETIRRLTDALARKASDVETAAGSPEDGTALTEALAERERRLARETIRRERLEKRVQEITAERDNAVRTRELVARERDLLQAELASLESEIGLLLPTAEPMHADRLDLRNLTVLYVGGRANQTPQSKGLVERINGRFLHHDGGLEHNGALLPGLVSRADLVLFPVDCISHEAAAAVKRTCRQLAKRYLPLRTSSLACLLSGLVSAAAGRAAAIPPDA